MEFNPVATIRSDFREKFGVPRQSGLVPQLTARIVFGEPYREAEALRGLEGFSHLWLIWVFSANRRAGWSPTVRPPRLGGNRRMGVFATRSPCRPNPIGLSCVRLLGIEHGQEGPALLVGGADLVDGTPILDIKPYLPYADCVPDASGGFANTAERRRLTVDFPQALLEAIPQEKREALIGVLREDPRPSYQTDEDRVYGVSFAGKNVRFRVRGEVLTVLEVQSQTEARWSPPPR